MKKKNLISISIVVLVGAFLASFIVRSDRTALDNSHHKNPDSQQVEDAVKGPHGGRLLSKEDFQLEITIYESGVPPQFRVYAFEKGKAINPGKVKLTIELHRLGSRVDMIDFKREADYLLGDKIVEEPHSFDVKVFAEHNGRGYQWEYSQIEGRVELSPDAVKSAGIIIEAAGPVTMKTTIERPGQIKLNADKLAHIVPRLTGIAIEVWKNLGDNVRKGEIIAVFYVQELTDLKREYLATIKRLELAQATFEREERLWKKKISAEQDYLTSRQALAEAEINLQAASQKLLALGLLQTDLDNLSRESESVLAQYEIRAPFDGTIIDKNITIGEAVEENKDIFVIADLSSVWAEVTIYANDLKFVRTGQEVTVNFKTLDKEVKGRLAYISPLADEETQTTMGRVVIPNPDRHWRPGLFVTVELVQEETTVHVAVSADAIQTFRDWKVVFVQYGNLFEVRPLELGRSDGQWMEVLKGISPGNKYAAGNSFVLKADLEKAGATHDH